MKYNTAENAAMALLSMNNYRIKGKILLVKYSNPPKRQVEVLANTNLYVKPLLPSTTEGFPVILSFVLIFPSLPLLLDDLYRLFSSFGPIDTVKVMIDKVTQASRQIGFVRFVCSRTFLSLLSPI